MTKNKEVPQKKDKKEEKIVKKCGIIMPIAGNTDYPKDHWKEVLSILVDAIEETEFEPRLVSDDVAIGLIHERIVNNIYTDDIVICDVSSKNPNVMFELGMRLAFDKPTIIIKDEKTGYSFDTGVIEHLNYPSSLRFNQIVEFKKELIKRINATYKKSDEDPNYSPFLKSFGKTIVPAKINKSEIPEGKYILDKLDRLTKYVMNFKNDIAVDSFYKRKNTATIYKNLPADESSKLLHKFIFNFLNENPQLTLESFNNNTNLIPLRFVAEEKLKIPVTELDVLNEVEAFFKISN